MSVLLCDDIVTSRLSLIAITPEMLLSEKNGDGRLGELIQCVIPANWPLTDWEPHVYDFLLKQLAEHPDQLGWPRYVGFVPADGWRTLIGSLGAFTKAADPSECEIGYGILPPYEGRGFATEGAKALIDYVRCDGRIESVIAHTFPSLPGSIRVMEKCGMVFDGEGRRRGRFGIGLAVAQQIQGSFTPFRMTTRRVPLLAGVEGVGHGVVAFAGLDLLALLAGDVEGAEGAVDLGVGGGVAGEVLGAEFVLNLVEGFLELLAVVADVDDAAAGVGGEALHVAGAGVGEVDAEASAVEAAVGDEDDVDDGVGLLGGFGGGLEGLLRALVAAVGEQDEDLAAGFLAELVVGGEVDGVEEQGAAGVAVAGDGAGAGAGVDLGVVDGALDLAGAVGVVGEEVDVDVEGDEEGLVLGGEDVFEELGAGLLLEGEDVHLAAAGVEEDADGEGEIFLLGEVLGLLKLFVLEDAAVVLVEVGDVAALVADGEVDVDEVDVDFEGLDVADVDGLGSALLAGGGPPGDGASCAWRTEARQKARAAERQRARILH